MISKAAYQNLISKNQYTYAHTVYDLKNALKQNSLKLWTQNLDVLHVINAK
jgi:NAD-dependent SIR2 family protein deacetylase